MENLTDLATEFAINIMNVGDATRDITVIGGVKVTKSDLTDRSYASELGRRAGLYYTLEFAEEDGDIVANMASCIMKYDFDYSRVLILGLGNPTYEADALGGYVMSNLQPIKGQLMMFSPLTSVRTGIESHDLIKAVVGKVKPSCVIAIDSLATLTPSRIGKCYQLSSAGLVPGSGVGNDRELLDREELGVDVLAIGVPFVSNIKRYVRRDIDISNMIVTPSNIDVLVKACAENIANSIYIALR